MKSNQPIHCPGCKAKLDVAVDEENPFVRCAQCGLVFQLSNLPHKPIHQIRAHEHLDHADSKERTDGRSRFSPRLIVVILIIAFIAVRYGRPWRETATRSNRAHAIWSSLNADVELDDDGEVVAITAHPSEDTHHILVFATMHHQLRRLSLKDTSTKDEYLRFGRGRWQLEILDLANTQITDEAFETITTHRMLKSLNLKNTATTDAGIAQIENLRRLEELGVSGTQISDEAMSIVGKNHKLKKLYLGHTAVTDEGLAKLQHLRQLEILNLRGTLITDQGLQHLRGLTKLKLLYLGETQITDAGINSLNGLSALEGVNVHQTKITNRGAERLESMLPRAMVIHEEP